MIVSLLRLASHILIVEGVVDHYGSLDHSATECSNPAFLFLVGFRVKEEGHSINFKFLQNGKEVSYGAVGEK